MSKQCPNCKQFKVITQAGMTAITGMTLVFIGVIVLIFILPLGLFLIGFGLILMCIGLISYFIPSQRKKLYCNNCKNKWEEK